ncbi:MAG: ABC transporter ATP-binding protein [Chloroflexi bacterium]|nr:ABC transporter ATP-binding protein [Chloroflexota bacterium]
MATLRLEDVTKRFEKVVAVNGLSFDVKDREFLMILGPTGAGKTTTLRCIAGLEQPEEGKIYVDDDVVNRLDPADRDVAFIFQTYALYPHMTVRDILAFPLKARHIPKDAMDTKIKEVTEILSIGHLLKRKPSFLSGGEMQRVAIGRAMVRTPKLFLMDEPLSNLDYKLRERMRVELKRLQNELKATVVYVTHDQTDAMAMADRIVVINHGELQQIGTPLEVYDRPANLFVARFVGSPTINLVDCVLEQNDGNARLRAKDGRLSLVIGDELSAMLRDAASQELIVGFRPEDVHVSQEPMEGAFESEVYVVESVGVENVVDLRLTGSIWKAVTPRTLSVRIGDRVWAKLDLSRVRVFDGSTEKALN